MATHNSQQPSLQRNDTAPVISVQGLTNRFGSQVIHEALDMEQRQGEILGVIGASGSGKSVLLRTIIGLRRPQRGRIQVLGTDVHHADRKARSRLERSWGVLFQDGALFSSLTVAQNIQMPLREHLHLPRSLMDEIASLKLRLVGLPMDAGAKYPAQLSGGMRKRAGLARALALDPQILFLDEPTAGLDPIAASGFDRLIRELQQTLRITVFLVTHDLDTLSSVCDRIAVLAEKRVQAIGSLDTIRQVDHPWVQEYFNGPRGRAARGLDRGN